MIDPFREAARYLTTTVALITTHGRHGPNVMSAEWAFQISYRPMRLITLVYSRDATHDNIVDTREFGANFLSADQAVLANLAGSYTGKEVNKLSSELFRTYPAREISPPMILGCFLNAECRVLDILETGDHTMFLADVLNVQLDRSKTPLLYHQRQYWELGRLLGKEPLLFVTCTLRPDYLGVHGRLQGTDEYPQVVSVTLSLLDSEPLIRAELETDERGYFELERQPDTRLPKGTYVATTAWASLKSDAFASID